MSTTSALRPGIEIGFATEADVPALEALERSVPIRVSDGQTYVIDRGEELWGRYTPADEFAIAVARDDDRNLVACCADLHRRVPLVEGHAIAVYGGHARTVAGWQGKGLMSALFLERQLALSGRVDFGYGYVASTNEPCRRP